MPFRKPIRSEAETTLTSADSTLEERNVFNRRTNQSAFSNGATSSRLPQLENSESSQITNQGPSGQLFSSTIGNQSQVFSSTPVLHPGVESLLNEYYKLLESTSSDSVVVRSNQYRPSFVMKLWKLLTLKLPTPLRYGQFLRQLRTLLEWLAPSSTLGIIFSLLMWLMVLKFVLEWPFTCLLTFVFGVCYLLIGEEKYKEVMLLKSEPKVQLEGFSVEEEDSGALPPMAKEYFRIKHHRRLIEGTNLNAMEWPNHLSKPDNCIKEEIRGIQEDVQKLRTWVMGPDQERSVNSDTGMSFESAVDSVHELCTLVGLDQTSSEIQDWDSLRNKIQELQSELGF
eukprot:g1783.t1